MFAMNMVKYVLCALLSNTALTNAMEWAPAEQKKEAGEGLEIVLYDRPSLPTVFQRSFIDSGNDLAGSRLFRRDEGNAGNPHENSKYKVAMIGILTFGVGVGASSIYWFNKERITPKSFVVDLFNEAIKKTPIVVRLQGELIKSEQTRIILEESVLTFHEKAEALAASSALEKAGTIVISAGASAAATLFISGAVTACTACTIL